QQEAAIFKASTLSKNRVLYAPEVPIRVDSPNLLLRALCLPVGLLLGAGLVLGRALFGSSFESAHDVRRSIVGVPVLATIPRAGARRRPRRLEGEAPHAFDVTALGTGSAFAEAFRTLRATFLAWKAACDSGLVVLVTSPQGGDGKTMFTWSLASALSASDKTVLVVESDLRRASTEDGGQHLGLRSVLRGLSHWRTSLDRVVLANSSFYALRAGGRDAPELLTLAKMTEVIDEVRRSFDFVLIDSASFPAASDALVLSRSTDVTLSLVRVGQTPRTLTADHLHELAAHTTDLAVVVNNAVEASRDGSEGVESKPKARLTNGTSAGAGDSITARLRWDAPSAGPVAVASRDRAGEP
ncbi:MAG TPA: hypothetical protein VK841_06680, partial [Polyangiaceae bacterium]|nr:hypothetical protein [Polyangiaceae bacterium]